MARRPRKLSEAEARLWSRIAAGTIPLPGRAPLPLADRPDGPVPAPSADGAPAGQAGNAKGTPRPPGPDFNAGSGSAPAARKAASSPMPAIAPFRIDTLPASADKGPAARPGSSPSLPPAQHAGHRPASLADDLRAAPLRMDPKSSRRLRKGKLAPQARIDLHGMTLAEAQPALIRFVLHAQASGLRLVLVITGKGRGSRDEFGHLSGHYPGALRHQVPHWLHMGGLAHAVAQVLPAHDRHGGAGAYYVWLRKPGR